MRRSTTSSSSAVEPLHSKPFVDAVDRHGRRAGVRNRRRTSRSCRGGFVYDDEPNPTTSTQWAFRSSLAPYPSASPYLFSMISLA